MKGSSTRGTLLALLAGAAVLAARVCARPRPAEDAGGPPRPVPKVKTKAEIDAEMIAGLLWDLGEAKPRDPADSVIVLLNALRKERGVEVELRIVRLFQRLRPLADRQRQLLAGYELLRWGQQHPEHWDEVSAAVCRAVGREGEPWASWKFEEWVVWYRKQRQIRQHDLNRGRIRARFDGMEPEDIDEATQLFEDVKNEWRAIFRLIEGDPAEEAARKIEAREELQYFRDRLFILRSQ